MVLQNSSQANKEETVSTSKLSWSEEQKLRTFSQFEIQRNSSKSQIGNNFENVNKDQSLQQSAFQLPENATEPIKYYQSSTKLENQSNSSAHQDESGHKIQGPEGTVQSSNMSTVEPAVQNNNRYHSSTTVMNQSTFMSKTESSQVIQGENIQGPSQLLRLPAVSAAMRTDALSSSPSAASHLSDSSQSTVVRQSTVFDSCDSSQSTVQLSKSESRYVLPTWQIFFHEF